MEAIKNNELNTLITIMRNNKYEIKERPYELNIVGVRTDNWTPNSFDDFIFVFYKDDKGNWQGSKNPATTDPGTYWLKNPMSPQGTAILKKGQYNNSHAIGSHRGQYTALVQVAPVTTIRDYDRDNKLSYESLKTTTGLYGINIHRAGSSGTTKVVDKYSAGCQVFSDASDFASFIETAKKHKDLYGNLFTYTLIDEREDAIRKRTKGDTFYSGDYRYHENTTGLLIFNLPQLTVYGENIRAYDNLVHNNNIPNFGVKGSIVSAVPKGTGVVIMATKDVDFSNNTIRNHKTANLSVVSYELFAADDDPENTTLEEEAESRGIRSVDSEYLHDLEYNAYPQNISIHENTFENKYNFPTLSNDYGVLMFLKNKVTIPDIVYDGILPENVFSKSNMHKICLDNNGVINFVMMDAANDFKNFSNDQSPYNCKMNL